MSVDLSGLLYDVNLHDVTINNDGAVPIAPLSTVVRNNPTRKPMQTIAMFAFGISGFSIVRTNGLHRGLKLMRNRLSANCNFLSVFARSGFQAADCRQSASVAAMAGIDQIFTRIIASVLDGRWPTEAELSHICPVSGSVNAVDGTSFTGNVSASQRAAAAVMQTSSVASGRIAASLWNCIKCRWPVVRR